MNKLLSCAVCLAAFFMAFVAMVFFYNSRKPGDCSVRDGGIFCSTSLSRISGVPDRYDNSHVSLFGYIAIAEGELYVFPSEWAYRSGSVDGRILIDQSGYDAREVFEDYIYGYAYLSGKFRVLDRDKHAAFVGIVGMPLQVMPVEARDKREGWEDLKVPLAGDRIEK